MTVLKVRKNLFSSLFFLSIFDIKNINKKEAVIEKSPGYLYGKIAFSKSNISTQTVGLKTTKIIAVNNPIIPPIKAPFVVNPFQEIVKKSIGKFVLAAMAKAKPTKKATFCP